MSNIVISVAIMVILCVLIGVFVKNSTARMVAIVLAGVVAVSWKTLLVMLLVIGLGVFFTWCTGLLRRKMGQE